MMELTFYPIVASSCIAFLLGYKLISPGISSWLSPGYRALPHPKQIEWNTRVNSSFHAIVVSIVCTYVLLFDSDVSNNPVWVDSFLVKTNSAIVVGYMFSDMLLQLWHYRQVGDLFSLMHHMLSCWAYYYVVSYGCLAWFANFRLLAELSTPSVNFRWFLDTLKCSRTSKIFMANGVIMTAIFFVVRVAAIPPFWMKTFSIYGTPQHHQLGYMWHIMIVSCILLDTINIFWFIKMVKGAVKVLRLNYSKKHDPYEDRKTA